jgi:hypothetical protein
VLLELLTKALVTPMPRKAEGQSPTNAPLVPKDKFDALLKRLTDADPAKRQDIKTKGKAGKIIPPSEPKPQSKR